MKKKKTLIMCKKFNSGKHQSSFFVKLAMLTLVLSFSFSVDANAQGFLKGLADKAKEKVKEKVTDKVENSVSNATDRVLNGKKSKKSKAVDNDTEDNEVVDDAPLVSTSSDFQRGSTILFQDDFTSETIGEFPSKWDLCSGAAEVKKMGNFKAVEITDDGAITPLIKQEGAYLPEQFTLEFDYYYWNNKEGIGLNEIDLVFGYNDDRSMSIYNLLLHDSQCPFSLEIPVCDSDGWTYEVDQKATRVEHSIKQGWHTVALSFNKRAMKVYVDGKRIVNYPSIKRQPTWFAFRVPFQYSNLTFIKNVVLAQGAVTLYDKNAQDIVAKQMEETGKFVTNNINFETGKATLLPESIEEIQKVADYMLKNKSVRFEVQGHCDNQGSDKVNDPLSQSRAEAVVAALVKLGVDEWNLRAVGKGSHEPIADNKTKEGQAKNRRVEFIKK